MLVAEAMQLESGMTVLDACAAPGERPLISHNKLVKMDTFGTGFTSKR